MNYDLSVEKTPWVWFDLDDTLWDFSRNSLETLREFYDVHNLRNLWPTFEAWEKAYHTVNAELWSRYGRGEISTTFLRTERFRRPFTDAGMPENEAEAAAPELDADYLDRLARRERLLPGAHELLCRLQDEGFRLGILSNGFADTQRRKMLSSGIEHFFSHVVLSEEAGAPKPLAEIFRYAERVSGARPSQCVMIGDNRETDIAGALNAGWEAIYIGDILSLKE